MDYNWEFCEQKYWELSEGDLVVYLMDSAAFFYSADMQLVKFVSEH